MQRCRLYLRASSILLVGMLAHGAVENTLPETLVLSGTPIELVAPRQQNFTEGPVVASNGTLFYTEPAADAIYGVLPSGEIKPHPISSSNTNGLIIDYAGCLLGCARGRVWRRELDSTVSTVATCMGSANDITLTNNGGMFFTVPVWGGTGSVYWSSGAGDQKVVIEQVQGFPNGIEYSASQKKLYVAYTELSEIVFYGVTPAWDVVRAGVFATVITPDGFAIDSDGNFWVANNSQGRIEVLNGQGVALGYVRESTWGNVQNCCFSPDSLATLYIAAGNGIYKMQTNVSMAATSGAPLGLALPTGPGTTALRSGTAHAKGYQLDGRLQKKPFPTSRRKVVLPR